MLPAHLDDVKRLLSEALRVSPSGRSRFLDSQLPPRDVRRIEVERLLAFESAAADFLAQSFPDQLQLLADREGEPPLALAGTFIGPYQLVSEIGHGGMATVYRARRADSMYDKDVAVKVIHSARLSDEMRSWISRERQILASLEHPNIARLYDAGITNDHLPYLVMEYIDARRLDDFAQQENLSIAQKISLFCEVCKAVAYAHQRLIVHRDLKPSNILVDRNGVPKLVDFGIAKILDDTGETRLTLTGAQRFTPDYASPEQFQGAPVSTASDVYSLGVVLYELIAGTLPYTPRSRMQHDIAHAVLFDEPTRLRVHAPSASRELEAILQKALRKEPDKRYASVDYLHDDLERCLRGVPVEAYQGDLSYRVSKWIRRNRIPLAFSTALVVVMAAGGYTTWQAARRSQRHLVEVIQLSSNLLSEIESSTQAGRQEDVFRILQDTQVRLARLARDNAHDEELLRNLLSALIGLGELMGDPGRQSRGDTSGAIETLEEAVKVGEDLYARNRNHIRHLVDVSRAHIALGTTLLEQHQWEGAERHFERAIAITESPAPTDSDPVNYQLRRQGYAVALLNLAQVRWDRKEFDAAIPLRKMALDVRRGFAESGSDAQCNCWMAYADTMGTYAWTMFYVGRFDEALKLQQELARTLETIVQAHPLQPEVLTMRARNDVLSGRIAYETDRLADAVVALQNGADRYRQIIRTWPPGIPNRRRLAQTLSWLVLALSKSGATDRRLQTIAQEAVALAKAAAETDRSNLKAASDHSAVQARLQRWLR